VTALDGTVFIQRQTLGYDYNERRGSYVSNFWQDCALVKAALNGRKKLVASGLWCLLPVYGVQATVHCTHTP
jgi:hypothetical protein